MSNKTSRRFTLKIIAPVLAAMLIFSLSACSKEPAAEQPSDDIVPASSDSADNSFSWTFEDGTLTISGSYMPSFGDGAPWQDNAPSVESIIINEGMTNINSHAFSGCTSLKSIDIPEGVQRIDSWAFDDCDHLSEVSIPASVKAIDGTAFSYCRRLEKFNLDPANESFTLEDGVLFNKDKTTLIRYPGRRSYRSYSIPDTVTTIGRCAFSCCDLLNRVTIPEGVTSIEDWAFSGCTALSSAKLPKSLSSFGENVFEFCCGFEEYKADPECIACCVEDGVLFNKDKTVLLFYPRFKGSSRYTVPDGVTEIGGCAFFCASDLLSVTIPASVKTIGYDAFSSCGYLQEVIVDPENEHFVSIDGVLYDKNCFWLLKYPANRPNGARYTIPDGVMYIRYDAFNENYSLSELTIPASMIAIEASAFNLCEQLSDVYYNGTEEKWERIYTQWGNERLLDANIHFAETE